MAVLLRDLRFASRLLIANPGFAATAILSLALGMGATTAVYTVVDAILFRPLPFKDSERLVRIYSEFPTFPNGGLRRFPISVPEFLEMRAGLSSYETIDAWQVGAVNLTTATDPVRVTATTLSGSLFATVGIQPQKGRWITAGDDSEGAPLAIVISDGLWRRAFAASRDVIGRETKLNGIKATIAGVMPAGFQFPPGQVDVSELWYPLQLTAIDRERRAGHNLAVLAKLRRGTSMAQARQELDRHVSTWGDRNTPTFHAIQPKYHPLVAFGMQDDVVRTVRPAMLVVLGAVAFVLLIACVNVANLLLARAEARQKEISVRVAMGAGTGELMRQFVAEGLLISITGAAIGLGVAILGVRLLLWAGAESIPRLEEVSVHWHVLLFTGAVLIATALSFGLVPLAQAGSRNTYDSLKTTAGRTSATVGAIFLRRGLVVAELSLALVLLVSCGLMLQAFWRLQSVNVGFDPENLLTMRIALPEAQYPDQALPGFVVRLEESLSRLPGVISATVMKGLPPQRTGDFNDTTIENFVGRPGGPVQNVDYWQFTGNRFFETLGARLVEGRFFDERDDRGTTPVVIVNETMARTFWPGDNPLGRRLRLGDPPVAQWLTVVGVVADMKNAGPDRPTGTELFMPLRQSLPVRNLQIVLRARDDLRSVVNPVRNAIHGLDPSLPVASVRTMPEVIAQAQSRPRFLSMLLSFFTTIAVILAIIGVYGVVSYSVERRTAEIGIRMAIGADRLGVLAMVLKQGLLLGIVGGAAGVVAAAWLTRFLKSFLFAIEPFDLPTFGATLALLFILTLLASWIPARRATRVDPTVALRND
jgi:putative ABC transport system permease protein